LLNFDCQTQPRGAKMPRGFSLRQDNSRQRNAPPENYLQTLHSHHLRCLCSPPLVLHFSTRAALELLTLGNNSLRSSRIGQHGSLSENSAAHAGMDFVRHLRGAFPGAHRVGLFALACRRLFKGGIAISAALASGEVAALGRSRSARGEPQHDRRRQHGHGVASLRH
jgi:hypothetical protein